MAATVTAPRVPKDCRASIFLSRSGERPTRDNDFGARNSDELTYRSLQDVLRSSLLGILSTAILKFLVAWNEYLIASVFLRSQVVLPLPIGLRELLPSQPNLVGLVMAGAVVMTAPPVSIFAFLNRYFSVGGTGGALAGE